MLDCRACLIQENRLRFAHLELASARRESLAQPASIFTSIARLSFKTRVWHSGDEAFLRGEAINFTGFKDDIDCGQPIGRPNPSLCQASPFA